MLPVDLIEGLLQNIVLALKIIMLILDLIDLRLQPLSLDFFIFHDYLLFIHLILPLPAVLDRFLHKCIVPFAPPL